MIFVRRVSPFVTGAWHVQRDRFAKLSVCGAFETSRATEHADGAAPPGGEPVCGNCRFSLDADAKRAVRVAEREP